MRSLRKDDVFQAIAHPIRRQMLELLKTGEKPAAELAEPFGVSLPAISQQLKVLKEVGLVRERRCGRQRIYQLHPKPLREVYEWVEEFEKFWIERLEALGEHLRKKHGDPNGKN